MNSSKKKRKPSLLSRIFYSRPVLWLTGNIARILTSLLFATYKVKISGAPVLIEAAKGKLILALWHDKLLLAPLLRKALPNAPLAVVVSNSRDGKLLASFVNTFRKTTPIFVAHDVRHGALLQMVEAIDEGKTILITPDGPRGPRHTVKPGIFFTQEKAGAQIISMHWQASKAWQLNTWDQMQIPKPFARVEITFQAVPTNSTEELEATLSGRL